MQTLLGWLRGLSEREILAYIPSFTTDFTYAFAYEIAHYGLPAFDRLEASIQNDLIKIYHSIYLKH